MTLIEHLAELRDRLFRAVLALIAGTVVGYLLSLPAIDLLIQPYCDLPASMRLTTEGGGCQLLATGVLEAFNVRLKVAVVIGLFIGGPIIFFQVWRFITPGLTSRERRYALPFVIGSQVMFTFGLVFSYFVIPKGLGILLSFGGLNITAALTAQEYLSFYLATALAFGIIFELPLVLILLSVVGVLKAAQLRQFRPYALVVNVVVAAIITPSTDAITLLFMAGPMALFYEVSIIAAWLIERSKRKRAAS